MSAKTHSNLHGRTWKPGLLPDCFGIPQGLPSEGFCKRCRCHTYFVKGICLSCHDRRQAFCHDR